MSQQSSWEAYCSQSEVRPEIQRDLCDVIASSKIVLLLDDSGSMSTPVRAPGANVFAPVTTTRWSELMGDVASIVQLVTAVSTQGIDVHFMNRAGLLGVTDPMQLSSLFAAPPAGATPMVTALRSIYNTYRDTRGRVLVILITDGEPSDAGYDDLYQTLMNKPSNFYISLVECNDNEEEMDFLTGWDLRIPRFHNQEDYAEELRLVRQVQGQNTKFTRANYVQMIVLSPVYPKYAIDIRRMGGKPTPNVFAGSSSTSANYNPLAAMSQPAFAAVQQQPAYYPPPQQASQQYYPVPPVQPPTAYPMQPSAPPMQAAVYPPPQQQRLPIPTAPSAPTASSPLLSSAPQTPWDLYCIQAEVRQDTREDLRSVAADSKIVLLLDDSGSMGTIVRPPPGSMSNTSTTRWAELMGDVASIVQLVTAVNQQGVDIHFMNRAGLMGVRNVAQLSPMFAAPPSGGTPMIGSLNRIFNTYSNVPTRVLVILITDGEPSDGNYDMLFRTLMNKPPNFYISLVECNDNAEEMEYLTSWDTMIPRFHNQEDYGEELRLVRQVQGQNTKFTRANYVQMIVLSPIFPKYAIDIRGTSNGDCCILL